MQRFRRYNLWLLAVVTLLLAFATYAPAFQDNDTAKARSQANLTQLVVVGNPTEKGRIRNIALELQGDAIRADREATLILQLEKGNDEFGTIRDLAKFLTSSQVSRVRTVAWIPETVKGNRAILALACREILMHPDASLGDIGRGEPLDEVDRQFVLSLVRQRHNPKISEALAMGMMDKDIRVLKATIQQGEPPNETTESRVITESELKRLLDSRVVIPDSVTIKEPGRIGLFSGKEARALDVLVQQTVEDRDEIAELYKVPASVLVPDPTSGEAPNVAYIELKGEIGPVQVEFIGRQIDRAVAGGANLVILEIDSPGGLLFGAFDLIDKLTELESQEVKTVAYIPKAAISAAALIALGCDEIYLHPEALIGDAGAIIEGPDGKFERAWEKVNSIVTPKLQEMARRKNRPPALLLAMMNKDLKVYEVEFVESGRTWCMSEEEIHNSPKEVRKGKFVPESGENLLLTLNGERARELKLAEPPVADQGELKQRLNIPADQPLVAVKKTWVDTLVFILNTDFALFFLCVIGVVCIYIEMHVTSGLLGIVAALCFSLFFWSRILGGTADWLEVVLFILGIACVAIEIFVIPGFGVFGVSGGLLVLSSIILATQTWGNLETNFDLQRLARTIGVLTGSLATVVVLAIVISKYLPHVPLLNHMVLHPPGTAGLDDDGPMLRPDDSIDTALSGARSQRFSSGQTGISASMLRPAGKAEFGNLYVDVVSEGPYIQKGAEIEIVEISGNRIVVREVPQTTA